MLWRFQLFVSWVITEIFHIWLVLIQTVKAVLQMFSFDIFVNSERASSFHCPGVVFVWLFGVVGDMSQSPWPAHLLLKRLLREAFRRSPPRFPPLCSLQKWCQDNRGRAVCRASHQLWKLKAFLSPDFYSSPTRFTSLSLLFPLCLCCL